MKNESVYRELFIANTIRCVAEGGFEAATTRAIAGERREIGGIKVNEAHIYRIFGTKDALFAETFDMLDNDLVGVVVQNLSVFEGDGDFRDHCEKLFTQLWRFLLQNENKCKYYTRYFHSVYFKNDIYLSHVQKYVPLIGKMSPLFVPSADVWSIFQHVLTSLLEFALRVYGGSLGDNEDTATHVFNVTYCAIDPYLKK